MLPLGAAASTPLLAACGGGGDDTPAPAQAAQFASASFAGMPAPSLSAAAAMATTSVASSLNVTLSDGSTQTFKLAYQPFFITGDLVPDGNGGDGARGRLRRHQQPADHRRDPSPGRNGSVFGLRRTAPRCCRWPIRRSQGVRARRCSRWSSSSTPSRNQSGARHVRHAAVADRRADARPGPGTGKLSAGEVPQRRHVAASMASGSPAAPACRRGTPTCRAKSTSRTPSRCASNDAVQGLQPEPVWRRRQGQPLPLRPPARSDGAIPTAPAPSRSTTAWAASRTNWCRSCRTTAPC